jgi:hypothetical protein
VRGRERGGQIPIEGLGLDLLGLSPNHPISDRRPRSNGQGWLGCGGAARSRGESSPETSMPATTGLLGLGTGLDAIRAVWRTRPWPSHQRGGTGGARGLSYVGRPGTNCPFLISWNFYCLFYLFSLGFSIQIQINFQIQAKSNMCNNSKNI